MEGDREESPFARPLGPVATAGWSAAFLLVFVFVASAWASIKPGSERDGVTAALLYTASALVTILAIARVHAPDAELRDVLGAKPIGFVALFVSAVMGACASFPLGALEAFLARKFPEPERAAEYEQALAQVSHGGRVAGVLALLFVAPIADELLFRGAFASGVARDRGKVTAAIVTSLAFALVSAASDLHFLPLYLGIGLVLAHARLATGSVLAALAAHLAYRGAELAQAFKAYGTIDPLAANDTAAMPSWKVVAAASAGVLACALLLARRSHVDRAPAPDAPAPAAPNEGDES